MYISKTLMVISDLEAKIRNFDIKFSTLCKFFIDENDNKLEELLKERLVYIFLLDENIAKINLEKLKNKMYEVKEKIKNLELIYRDFRDFFYLSHFEDIKKINEICIHLKNDNLNYFDKNCKNAYDSYEKYLKDAQIRSKKRKSKFYNEIFDMQGKYSNENNEIERLNETEKKFNEFRAFFQKDGIYKINTKFVENYIRPFRNYEEQLESEIEEELKTLIDIFEIKNKIELKEILEGIILIYKKKYFFDITDAVCEFISAFAAQRTNFFGDIKNINKELEESIDINAIINCKKKLIELKILNEKKNDNKLIEFLLKFQKKPYSIIFLFYTTILEFKNLQEIAVLNDNDDNYFFDNVLLDTEKCIKFCLKIGKIEDLKKINDNEIISKLKENLSKDDQILVYITNYMDNYEQIRELNNSLDSSSLKYKVQELLKSSTYFLSNKPTDKFKCIYLEKNGNTNKNLEIEDIKAFRERALLSKKITPDYKYFIESANEIINISKILEKIRMKGYPGIITVKMNLKVNIINNKDRKMEINPTKEYYLNEDNSKKDYQEIIEKLNYILSELKTRLINAYESKPMIRFIYGYQFNLLSSHLKQKDDKLIPLLKYITNDLYKKEVDNFVPLENELTIQNSINNCEKYLNEVLKINNLDFKKIYETTIIRQKDNDKKYQGLYIYLSKKLEKELYQIYKYLTGNNPIAQNILLCNEDTTNEEITSFLYRSIKCEFESCFIIMGIEILCYSGKITILDLLNHFFPEKIEKINSCIIFLFSNEDSDIYKNLYMEKYTKILYINKFSIQKYEGNNIEIIKSDRTGVGKSTQIRKDIEDCGKKYIFSFWWKFYLSRYN